MKEISFPTDGYDVNFDIEDQSFWFQHRNNVIVELINDIQRGQKIWDIGGGNGFVSHRLQVEGWDTTLLEPGVNGCKNAKRRGLKKVVCGQVHDIPTDVCIENAICCDVIEHIENSQKFLLELAQRMPIGGRLLVTVPAYSWLWSQDDVLAGHFRRYTRASLIEELTKANFRANYVSYFFLALVGPLWLVRRLPYLFGFRDSSKEQGNLRSKRQHSMGIGAKVMQTILRQELKAIGKRQLICSGTSVIGLFTKT